MDRPERLGPRTRPRSQRIPHTAIRGVPPEDVESGQASPEPRCRHVWEVRASQRWMWRVEVTCLRCAYHLPLPGRFWRRRDVEQVVNQTLARMAREHDAWEDRP